MKRDIEHRELIGFITQRSVVRVRLSRNIIDDRWAWGTRELSCFFFGKGLAIYLASPFFCFFRYLYIYLYINHKYETRILHLQKRVLRFISMYEIKKN